MSLDVLAWVLGRRPADPPAPPREHAVRIDNGMGVNRACPGAVAPSGPLSRFTRKD